MAEEEQRPKLRIKNGAMIDVRNAVVVLSSLRAMLDVHPEKFQSLLSLVQGRPAEAHPEHVQSLQKRTYVNPDGTVRQDVADVLLSSFEIRDGGPVLVNPFMLQSERDKDIVNRVQEQANRALIDALFGRGSDGQSRG